MVVSASFQKELALAVVADEKLNACEEVVFEAVVAWGEANKADGSVCDVVASFVPHMRFVEMGHAFIQHRVRQSGLVPPDTVCDVLMKIMDEKIPQLEPGCKRAFLSENETDAGGGPAKKRRRG